MDTRLRMIEELYERDGNLADRIRDEQPDLMNEFESMRSLKSALDARPARRPDRWAMDAVLKAAANAPDDLPSDGSSQLRRMDRKPRARRGVYLRSAGLATAVVTVLIAVTTVWQADILEEVSTPAGVRTADEHTVAQRASPQVSAPSHGVDELEASADSRSAAASDLGISEADGYVAESDDAFAESGAAATESGRGVVLTEDDRGVAGVHRDVDLAEAHMHTIGARARLAARGSDRDERTAQYIERSLASLGSDAAVRTHRPIDSGYAAAFNKVVSDPTSARRPSDILPIGVRPQANLAFYDEPANDLAWDQVADVVEMYQQIEMIEEGVARGWEPPSVPLEMVPALQQQRGSSIQPVGDRRNH